MSFIVCWIAGCYLQGVLVGDVYDGVVILLSLVDAARPLSGAVLHWLKIYFCLFSLIARFHACLF